MGRHALQFQIPELCMGLNLMATTIIDGDFSEFVTTNLVVIPFCGSLEALFMIHINYSR